MALKPFTVVPLDLGTITTGNERTEYPAIHLNQFLNMGMVWQTNGTANAWVRFDFGSAKAIDFVSVISANALAGTTVRVRLGDSQAEVDGTADYDSTALAFISPSITREDGLYHSHLELPSVQTKRWMRIDIGGHTGDFQAAAIIAGQKVTPSRYYNRDFEFGIEDLGELEFTRWGVADDTDGRIQRTLRFTLGWQTEAEYQNSFRPIIEKVGKRKPVYWCFDPEANTYRQAKTYLGILKQSPGAVAGVKPGTYASEYSVLSVI